MNKGRIVKLSISIFVLLLLIVGFSYARININVNSTETNLIKAGCLKVDLTDEGEINLENAVPMSNELGLMSEPYIYKITNSCTLTAYYEATYNILNTTNSNNLSKVYISLKGDTYLAPTLINNLSSATMYKTYNNITNSYLIDNGYLAPGQTKTFLLREWIKEDVTEFTGTIDSKIIINSKADDGLTVNSSTSGYSVFENNQVLASNKYSPNYSYIAPYTDQDELYTQNSGMYKASNNKYYFRGNITNNYIKFGTYQETETINYTNTSNSNTSTTHTTNNDIIWRIVGINESGSIRLVLDDLIAFAPYNSTLTTYEYNTSSIKEILEDWYDTHLSDLDEYIENYYFCQDSSSTVNTNTYYGSYTRNVTSNNPSITCNDNYKINKKIGLLSVDELAYAGLKYNTNNSNNYLSKSFNRWTISPMMKDSVEKIGIINNNSINYSPMTTNLAVVPVINLSKDAILTGTGTSANKYQVIGLYEEADDIYTDSVAPTIIDVSVDEKATNSDVLVTVNAKDNVGGTGIVGYILTTTTTTPSLSDSNWKETTENKYYLGYHDNGTYYAWAKDAAGNISNYKQIIISNVDKVSPTCTISVSNNNNETSTKLLTIVPTSEDVTTIGYSWTNTQEFGENKSKIITSNGTYTAHVKDRAGNTGNCSITISSLPTRIATLRYNCSNNNVLIQNITAGSTSTINQTCTKENYTLIGWSLSNDLLSTYTSKDIYEPTKTFTSTETEEIYRQNNHTLNLYPIFAKLTSTYVVKRGMNYSDGTAPCELTTCSIPYEVETIKNNDSSIQNNIKWDIYIDNVLDKSNENAIGTTTAQTRETTDTIINIKACLTSNASICTPNLKETVVQKDYYIQNNRIYDGAGNYTTQILGIQNFSASVAYVKFQFPSYTSHVSGETVVNGYGFQQISNYSVFPSNVGATNKNHTLTWVNSKPHNTIILADLNTSSAESTSLGPASFTAYETRTYSFYPCYKDSNNKYTCHQ